MKELNALIGLETINIFGINEYKNLKDIKKKKTKTILMVTIFLVLMIFAGYYFGLACFLCMNGLAEGVTLLFPMFTFVLMTVFGVWKAKSSLYREKDLWFVSSLPVSGTEILVSRIVRMYIEGLIISVLFFLPGMIVYGIHEKEGTDFYLTMILTCIILPVISTFIAAWVGIIVSAVIARNRHKVLTEVVISLVIVIGTFLFSGMFTPADGPVRLDVANLSPDEARAKAEMISHINKGLEDYKNSFSLIRNLSEILREGKLVLMLILGLISVALIVITAMIIGRSFFRISAGLFNVYDHREYKFEAMKVSSLRMALIRKEAGRYFSSGIYVSNTIIGPVLAVVTAIALGFFNLADLTDKIKGLPVDMDINSSLPYIFSIFFLMMNISASSVSLEGKNWWLPLSLPLSAKDILLPKLIFNLIVLAPFYLVSEIIMLFTVHITIIQRLWLLLIPLIMGIFSVLLGLLLNLKFPKFNWEKDTEVVKQSAAVGISILGIFVAVIPGIAAAVIPLGYNIPVNIGVLVILGVICICLYNKIIETKLEQL